MKHKKTVDNPSVERNDGKNSQNIFRHLLDSKSYVQCVPCLVSQKLN